MMAFDPDGRRLAIASDTYLARVLDTTTGVEIFKLIGHCAKVIGVAYSPDGRRLASAGEDRTVRVWDATNGSEIFCLRGHTAPVRGVAFSPDGQRLASISRHAPAGGSAASGEVVIWDLSNGQSVLTLPGLTESGNGSGTNVTFSPDGQYLATSEDRTVHVWNAATGQEVLTAAEPRRLLSRRWRIVETARGSPPRVATGRSRSGTRSPERRACDSSAGHTSAVHGLTYSPDGRRLVTAAGGTNKGGERLYSEIKLWDALTGQEIFTLHGSPAQAPRVAFDRSGRRLAASGDRRRDDLGRRPPRRGACQRAARGKPGQVSVHPIADPGCGIGPGQKLCRQRCRAAASPHSGRADLARPGASGGRAKSEVSVQQRLCSRSEVLAALRADPVLSEPVRQEALALAERLPGVPDYLNMASRAVASRPGAESAAYRLAVERAEIACRLMPFEGSYQTTLGMAQYRLGKYQEALTTLTHADKLNQAAEGSSVPADLAFLAMTRFQIGETDQAQASLAQLRETSQKPNWAEESRSAKAPERGRGAPGRAGIAAGEVRACIASNNQPCEANNPSSAKLKAVAQTDFRAWHRRAASATDPEQSRRFGGSRSRARGRRP